MPTLLHDRTRTQLQAVTATHTSLIFHGAPSLGKYRSARELATTLNCSESDLIVLAPADKPSISIEQVRGLLAPLSLALTSPEAARVVILDQAEALTVEAQNALLKLIEEPPPRTVFILVASRIEQLLPTIRSRCAAIYFPTFPDSTIAGWLTTAHNIKPATAAQLATASGGIPGTALTLSADPAVAAAELELTRQAGSLPTLGLFQRLLLAKKLIDAKSDLFKFGQLLQQTLLAQITSGRQPNPSQFAALEQFRSALGAKVAPRVALEQLMVEF